MKKCCFHDLFVLAREVREKCLVHELFALARVGSRKTCFSRTVFCSEVTGLVS